RSALALSPIGIVPTSVLQRLTAAIQRGEAGNGPSGPFPSEGIIGMPGKGGPGGTEDCVGMPGSGGPLGAPVPALLATFKRRPKTSPAGCLCSGAPPTIGV